MTDVKVLNPTAGVGRLGTAAAWISAAACLPYLFLKLVWTLDLPVGVTDRSQLHSSEWVAGNAVMAVVQLVAVVLVLALVRPWSRRVPTWLLLFPVWVGTGLLFQVVVGSAIFLGLSSTASQESGTDTGGIAPWVYVVVYAAFAVQGVALAIAFGCHVRARWGRMLGERTGDVLARPSSRIVAAKPPRGAGGDRCRDGSRRRCRLRLLGGRRLDRTLRSATARQLRDAGIAGGGSRRRRGRAARLGRSMGPREAVLAAGSTHLGRLRCPGRVRRADGRAQPARS